MYILNYNSVQANNATTSEIPKVFMQPKVMTHESPICFSTNKTIWQSFSLIF